jgi:isopenicillin N synthase-like dioxygenase
MEEYSKQVMNLGILLLELLSEALGLKAEHLNDIDCGEGVAVLCHYYPACPQPELTMGAGTHTDNDFFTVLLQDHIGGLQVSYQDKWIDVPPVAGALVVNIGDLLQASLLIILVFSLVLLVEEIFVALTFSFIS